jgi:hypothetical protein
VLVPRLQATGAAIAVTLSICCRVGYRVRWVVKLLALEHLLRELRRLLLAVAAGVAALAGALALGPLPALAAALGAYLLVLAASGAVRPSAIAGARRRLSALFSR